MLIRGKGTPLLYGYSGTDLWTDELMVERGGILVLTSQTVFNFLHGSTATKVFEVMKQRCGQEPGCGGAIFESVWAIGAREAFIF